MNYLALLFFLLFVGYAWLFVLVIVTHRKLKEAEARLHDMYVRTFHIEQLAEDINTDLRTIIKVTPALNGSKEGGEQ